MYKLNIRSGDIF